MPQLTKEEIVRTQNFLSSYPIVHEQLDTMLKSIESFTHSKNILLRQLEELRSSEAIFMEELRNKYGEGGINTKTWTYETK